MSNKNLKMCQSCRGLIAANAATCPLCGMESHYPGGGTSSLSGVWSVNTILLTANLVIYVLVMLYQLKVLGLAAESRRLDVWSPASEVLDYFGAVYPGGIATGEFWRLLTMCFLHGGLLHLGLNSYALLLVGREAEEAYGGAKYLCLYLVAGICGSLAVIVAGSAAVGASGALFGVIGAMAVYGYKRGDFYGRALKSSMVQWLIYGLVMSFMPGISLAAHVGGLIGGAGLAYLMGDAEEMRRSLRRVRWWQVGAAVSVLLITASLGLGARNVWRQTETRRLAQLTIQFAEASRIYERGQRWKSAAALEKQRGALGATITTLEHTRAMDDESAALQQRLLDLLRERQRQLQSAASPTGALLDLGQFAAFEQVIQEYGGWLQRKSRSLGITQENFNQQVRLLGGISSDTGEMDEPPEPERRGPEPEKPSPTPPTS
jgi:rhomboid protease GluP